MLSFLKCRLKERLEKQLQYIYHINSSDIGVGVFLYLIKQKDLLNEGLLIKSIVFYMLINTPDSSSCLEKLSSVHSNV
jgi:hypothetical protein